MLTDKEIFDAVNEAPLGRTGETTVISVGRAIEAKVLEKLGTSDWLLYEHDDGRHAVASTAEAATFAHGDPAWHRVGPVAIHPKAAA